MKGRELALLALIALIPRLVHLDHPPQFDELYHVLAASSWAADGTLALGDGVYERTSLFTKLIGLLFRFFDDTLLVARIPSVVAGTAWVILVASWTSGWAGRAAGWTAGLLFAGDPGAIYLSQFARFYALHGLLFFAGASGMFNLVEQWTARSVAWKWWVAAFTAAALLAATYLQSTTLIGLVALGTWAVWRLSVRWWTDRKGEGAIRWVPVILIAAGLVLGAIFASTDFAGQWWRLYRSASLWGTDDLNRIRFYEQWLVGRYPVLWALLPLAVLVAAWRFRAVALFAAVTFGVAFILHSFAGAKTERYLYFAMPYFFVIWGVAVASALPWLRRIADEALWPTLRIPDRVRRAFGWVLLGAAALVVAYYNPATRLTRRLVYPGDEARPYAEPDWSRAAPALRQLADSADVVVSSALPKAMYYLGRGDVTLSLSELVEVEMRDGRPVEFAIDRRTGRPAISSAESLKRVQACYGRGLVIIEENQLRVDYIVPDSTAAYLMETTREVALAPSWRIRAFQWQRDSARTGPDCPRARGQVPYSGR